MNTALVTSVLILGGWGLSSGYDSRATSSDRQLRIARSTTTPYSRLTPGYDQYPSLALPRMQAAGIGANSAAVSAKPFSDYRPAAAINPNAHIMPRSGFQSYEHYKSWSNHQSR